MSTHLTMTELEAGLPEIRRAPRDGGALEMIVVRPDKAQRQVLEVAELSLGAGLVGDNWRTRGSTRTEDGSAHPDMQIAVMSARVIELLARGRDRWPLAGDQLYVDLDLSEDALPPGQRLEVGEAVLEITAMPHTGCKKFVDRFGADAMRWVNSDEGRTLRLRGVYAKVVRQGTIRAGEVLRRL